MKPQILEDTLVGLVFDAVAEALRTEDSAAFLAWMRAEAPRSAPAVFDRFPPELASRMGFWIGVAIWNVTPLPGNGFRPRPLPQPQRNQPCVCGSGRKLKHCCGERPALPSIPVDVAWQAVIAAVPAAQLREAAAAGRLPAQQLGRMALGLLDLGKPRQALALVEPLFLHPERADERFSEALHALLTSYLALGRQRKREQVVERLTRELRPPLRAQAWARRATMLVDQERHEEAWLAWERARQDDPGDTDLDLLEVTLLLARGNLDRAAERARVHLTKRGRSGLAVSERAAFLQAAADDPLAPALQLTAGDAWPAAYGLAALVATVASEPVELRYTIEADPGDPTAGILKADATLRRLEREWRKTFPRTAAGLDGAIWDEEFADRWLDFLAQNGAAFDSFEVLFDLAVVALKVLGPAGASILRPRLEPLVRRGTAIFDGLLAGHPRLTFPSGAPVHSAAAGLLAEAPRRGEGTAADPDTTLGAMERLARLMPGDPLLRGTLTTLYLSRGEDQRALDAAGSEASSQGGVLDFCKVLALYRLGRKGEALAELSLAVARWPDAAYLLAVDVPRPRAARRAAQAIGVAGSSCDVLRVLLRQEPELHLWLQEREVKARRHSQPPAAPVAGAGGKDLRSAARSARRLTGPRPVRARPPAVPRQDRQRAERAPDARLRLKVTLRGTRPPVWRRLEVSGKLTLARFHHVLQAAMGWTDSHLHLFIAGGEHYSDPSYDDLGMPMRSERGTKLGTLLRRRGDRIDYEYDFGDSWEDRIVLEEVLPSRPGAPAAVCLAGRRRCPPEDCGGLGGYYDLLELLRGRDSQERREMVEWLGSEIDPAAFDLADVNRQLSRIV
jgi:tetratricopeptide (TPR) repeat protein